MPDSGDSRQKDWTEDFVKVRDSEHMRIQLRRDRLRPGETIQAFGPPPVEGKPETDTRIFGTNGVCLSGGGIRSAAFCLGALQALGSAGKMDRIDYLSTVSGGGYIGSALVAGMSAGGGAFPFTAGPDDKSDNHVIGRIRDYANYLMPHGIKDLLASASIILRGLAVNLAIVLAFIMVCAGLTRWANPDQAALKQPDIFGIANFPFHQQIALLGEFAITKLLVLASLAFLVLWGVVRSIQEASQLRHHGNERAFPEFADKPFNAVDYWHAIAYGLILLVALSLFLEMQPYAIRSVYSVNYGDHSVKNPENLTLFGWFVGKIASISSQFTHILAPVSAVLAIASKYFGDNIRTLAGDSGWRAIGNRLASKAALGLVALALPIVIWVAYLNVTVWIDIGFNQRPAFLQAVVNATCSSEDVSTVADAEAAFKADGNNADVVPQPNWPARYANACKNKTLLAYLLFGTGAGFLALAAAFLRPNTNSLHRLYRDRLGKAFLFDPSQLRASSLRVRDTTPAAALDGLHLSALDPALAPLQLINTALNIQGSKTANKRGRQADFFFFTPEWSGSLATGFMRTHWLEKEEPSLDIATLMAVSGAAASSNMGSKSIRGLAPTLALLNIRLGFWMRNPRDIAHPDHWRQKRAKAKLYLPAEMFSLLDEESPYVYLTDGGHIDNLGLYELLRRRCKTILVIDGEADPGMNFQSFVETQRYARIDLGVRVELPWAPMRDAARELDSFFARDEPGKCANRPEAAHVCVGTIDYGLPEPGILIYVKSCLTGDENDNILNYKTRNQTFPHESTGDQFFTEEQFEVYRALGNHALRKALSGECAVAGPENLPGYPRPPAAPADVIAARRDGFERVWG